VKTADTMAVAAKAPVPRHMLTLLAVLAFLCPARAVLAQGNAKTVLVVYDGGREFSSIQLTDRGIDTTLRDALGDRVTIFREYMDLTRISTPDYASLLRTFYRSKYASNRPDVIIAIRSRSLDFLLVDGDRLFPSTPIVSAGMAPQQVRARALPPEVTGTTLKVAYWPTVGLARTLQPEINEVVLVIGASPNDRALEALVREELKSHADELKFTYLSGLSVEDTVQRVSHLPARTAVLFVSFAQDARGRSFLPTDAVRLIARAANVPTYVNSEDVLDAGAVGGSLMSFVALGTDAAAAALRILSGGDATAMPFTESSARTTAVDARELKRWSIPIARVPAGSVVLNQAPTVWEAYRWRIIAGTVLLVLQSALIATLLVQRRRRRLAEAGWRSSEERRHSAVLDERSRMARDMHDTLAQGFTGVIVQLQAAQHARAHGSMTDMESHLARASELARQSLGDTRRSIRALRPAALDTGSLSTALEGMLQQVTAGTKLRAAFAIQGEPRMAAPLTEENLVRIQQEMLTNVLKHSGATTVSATLWFEAQGLRLDVHDDGNGFDPKARHDGLGLIGIRERVHQLGGQLSIDTHLGSGTNMSVSLPYNQPSSSDQPGVGDGER
jgi:signal transduction histidine kinase